MHHNKKKKYTAMKEAGATEQELREALAADGIDQAEIDEFIVEIFSQAPDIEDAALPVQKKKAVFGSIYEEWKMSRSIDGDGKKVLEKVKKIKDVKIDHLRAERLNAQAGNRLIKYFLKQN